MNSSRFLKLAGLAACVAFAAIPESRADVVLTNLDEEVAGGSPVGNFMGTNLWWGSRFVTDISAPSFELESVVLDMAAPEFINATGSFFVAIYSDVSNEPGMKLGENLIGTDNPSTAGEYTYMASGQTLFAGTSYWLVAGVTNETALYSWNASQTMGWDGSWTIPAMATHIHSLFGGSGGTDWDTASPESPRVFSISASPIPEPATIQGFLLAGITAFAFAARQRRRLTAAE